MSNPPIPYIRHEGTLVIAGDTDPAKAGRCAAHFLNKGQLPIDFLCIGVEANQQATKSMGFFRGLLIDAKLNLDVSFVPLRYSTTTVDDYGNESLKDCVAWRAIFHIPADTDTAYEIKRSTTLSVTNLDLQIEGQSHIAG